MAEDLNPGVDLCGRTGIQIHLEIKCSLSIFVWPPRPPGAPNVKIMPKMFAEGALRSAHFMLLMHPDGTQERCVAKWNKEKRAGWRGAGAPGGRGPSPRRCVIGIHFIPNEYTLGALVWEKRTMSLLIYRGLSWIDLWINLFIQIYFIQGWGAFSLGYAQSANIHSHMRCQNFLSTGVC